MQLLLIILLSLTATLGNAASLLVPPPLNLTSLLNPNRITFSEAVVAGRAIVLATYPGALLVEVQATTMMNPVRLPKLLTDMRLVFRMAAAGPYKSIVLEMQRGQWGQWQQPRLLTHAPAWWLGQLRLPLEMDIVEADHLLKAAGYAGGYWGCDVTWPVNVPADRAQAIYDFQMADEEGNPDTVLVLTRERIVVPN